MFGVRRGTSRGFFHQPASAHLLDSALVCIVLVAEHGGAHVDRWRTALLNLGFNINCVLKDRCVSNLEFLDAIDSSEESQIVICGPLALAQTLVPDCNPLLLLSWGFDLQDAEEGELFLADFAAVIVDSTANQRIAKEHGARKVVLIPWGVDLEELHHHTEVADLSRFGVAATERVVLSLRAHEEMYRVSDIIEAFALTEIDARLVVGNTGSLTTQLQELALELGVDATFIPAVSEDRVPSLLRRASVYVTASRVDGTSVTLLQAMACGVPVVASANAGNADWVEDGVTGFVFPVGDTRALSHAIERALREGDNVISAAREQVHERADWRHNIEQLKELFESL